MAEMQETPQFCAVGYSTRALCQAFQPLGIRPISLDAFADHDCQRAAKVALRAQHWGTLHDPEATESIVQTLGDHGNPKIVLAGGTENWPYLIKALGERFDLLGPTAEELSKLRDPSVWRTVASEAGIGFPKTIDTDRTALDSFSVDPSMQWLTKPYAGAGGIHVSRLAPASPSPPAKPHGTYLQQWVSGRVVGAHCVVSDSHHELLGITESLTEEDWPGPSEFIYRGSWGPQPATEVEHLTTPILKLAKSIRDHTGLRGWVQFDLVESSNGKLWLLEVNPRWAAGMELIVESGRDNPVAKHLGAFGFATPKHQTIDSSSATFDRHLTQAGESCWAKAILYAPKAVKLTAELLAILHHMPCIADIPAIESRGQVVEQGHPLLTVKASLSPAFANKVTWPERKQKLLGLLHQRAERITALF